MRLIASALCETLKVAMHLYEYIYPLPTSQFPFQQFTSHLNKSVLSYPRARHNNQTINQTIMHRLAKIALLLPSVVTAIPQYPGVVYCDSTMVSEPNYETKGQKDVTEQYGDKGWENYDNQVCTSYQEGKDNLALQPHSHNSIQS